MTLTLTAQQQADAAYVEGLAPPKTRIRLDLSDDRQYRHAVAMHVLGGQTPEEFPGLHAALAQAREAHIALGGPPPLSVADDAGFETGGVISDITTQAGTVTTGSTAFSSVLGGAPMLSNVLVVKDQNAVLLANGSSAVYGDGSFLPVATNPTTARPIAAHMTGTLQYSYQPGIGQPIVVENVYVHRDQGPLADPVVQQPVKRAGTPGPQLRIGLGRGNGATNDVDYWFWQGQTSLIYAVPLVGYADFDGTIATPLSTNLTVAGYLARANSTPAPDPGPKGGILEISAAQITNVINSCQPSGGQLTYTLPAATSVTNPGNPITWVPAPWDTSELTYFMIQFTVNLVGQQQPAVASIMSSSTPDTDPLDGMTTIPPIQFVFHCLAAGTQITLADGSSKAIEDLTSEDSVLGGDGSAVAVVATMLGHHKGEVLRLAIDGDRELVLSHNHLVLTADGPVPAGELSVGDQLLVEGGQATLRSVTSEEYDGLLANASLVLSGEPADPARESLLANGVRVGDYELQVQVAEARRNDPERILAALDPLFHEDYRRHLARTAAA